jgi:hypothetical protein
MHTLDGDLCDTDRSKSCAPSHRSGLGAFVVSGLPKRGGTMRYLVISDGATPEDIHAAIQQLRAKQLSCVIASTRAEVAADIDELLDLLPR